MMFDEDKRNAIKVLTMGDLNGQLSMYNVICNKLNRVKHKAYIIMVKIKGTIIFTKLYHFAIGKLESTKRCGFAVYAQKNYQHYCDVKSHITVKSQYVINSVNTG